jgi:hypothetical protein
MYVGSTSRNGYRSVCHFLVPTFLHCNYFKFLVKLIIFEDVSSECCAV